MKVGDRVSILSNCVKYRKKDIRGKDGTIEYFNGFYNAPYGVRIDGKTNDGTKDGLFWFAEEDLLTLYTLNKDEKHEPIKDVIFNDPATIVLWRDGSKTVVKCGEDDIYDPEKGLAMCIAKKYLGNQGNYYETFKKWLPEEKPVTVVIEGSLFDRAIDAISNFAQSIGGRRENETVEYYFDNFEEALNAKSELEQNILTFGHATVADMNELLGIVSYAKDRNVGWTNTFDFKIEKAESGCKLILPKYNWRSE